MLLNALSRSVQVLFLGGKGGVGKTSTASAVALHRARAGGRVLLVSTDPAHNIGHLWEREIGDDVVTLFRDADGDGASAGRLDAVEVDPRRTVRAHVREVGQTLRSMMPEHLHRQVDEHLRMAEDSPGTHESALLERIAELVEQSLDDYDLIVFDTAPSGHTARLMALPETMTVWTEGLLARRDRAERFGAAVRALDRDDDPATQRDRRIRAVLTRRRTRFEQLRDVLRDERRCAFVVVLTPERLPVLESAELVTDLQGSGVRVGGLVVNRLSPDDAGEYLARRREQELRHVESLRELLPEMEVQTVPLLPGDVVGADAVGRLADLYA
ncbi:MAG: ArsA family ATPase [Nesterenkonia sp.]|uniref:ArsA family ATPase n=1 Tax=Nesterenkonia marinintestina TaxID=2979865 RepID=UPI0021BE6328|nr:ArsA family ATPase [Nesterenkonia sp. GX14115]MDO5492437.1 ArsA family ATPase [Nesterenkonia sp.]